MSNSRIRVRFAPSPTGPLHIGGVRTALYNYLFAKKNGGDFLLRIEDTDQTRFVEGAEEYIMNSLKWCGINWDEGPDKNTSFGPYRQSERKEMYKKYAVQLLDSGNAYYAFDTSEELDEMRKKLEADKTKQPQYDCHSRKEMKNSLTLSSSEVDELLNSNTPYVIRFKMPEDFIIEFDDLIRGHIKVNSSTLDDKVLFKSDGMPTYHLANVVDDYLMQITHVIRGEEWLPSAPLHVMLYKSFGWTDKMPDFAHLPLLLKPDGNGKLSKRDGDRLGFPVFPMKWTDPKSGEVSSGYKESGYFPDAFINMLALMGWNPGTEQEIFSMDELVNEFSIERVNKSGAKFDPEKAKWFNHKYLLNKNNEEIANLFANIVKEKGFDISINNLVKLVSLVKDRVNFVHELWDQLSFFFIPPQTYDEKTVKGKWKENTAEILTKTIDVLNSISNFSVQEIDKVLHEFMEQNQIPAGQLMIGLRISMVGEGKGPDLKEIMAYLGKEEVAKRIQRAVSING
ncbi:MAG: glutamate--tRNA ligase [Bacteroidetes bacterium]|nr:glutamate--tRNA ligase [Bacteroidota bacterium]